jgi:hypothetical protein
MIYLHSTPHISQSVSKCTVLKIYCHTSFQYIQLSVSSFSHSISSHVVVVVAGHRKLKMLGVTSSGIIFIPPFKKISQLVQKLECCEGGGGDT